MNSFCGVADLKEDQSPASKIGCNAVVLLSIARASDFSTLKSLRQVDSFWAQAVSRVFTQRASVNLKPGKKCLKSLRSFAKDTKGMEGKLKVLNIHCESEVKIKLKESIAFNDILQTLSPFLETLELAPQNFHGRIFNLFNPRIVSKSQFPVLRTLVLDNNKYDILRLVPKLFEATPALERLKLSRLSYLDDASFVLSPLQIIGEDGSIGRNWDLAPNLRSLTLFAPLSPAEAEALSTFPQAWEALELCWSSCQKPGLVAKALGQLFEKNKEALLSLSLQDINYEVEPQAKVKLQFPSSFPKLKILQFYFEGRAWDHIKFDFERSKNLIEYSKLCTNLRLASILVKLEEETELRGIWAKFFPQTVYSKAGIGVGGGKGCGFFK